MNIIKGLVVKDFQTIKSYKSTVFFMTVLFVACSFISNNFVISLSVFMPLLFGMLGLSSFSYDDLAKADKYVLTFPVNKKDVVKARYIYILIVTLSGTVLGLIFTILAQGIKTSSFFDKEFLSSVLASVIGGSVGIMFIQSFQIPIMYKFGAEKGRIIQMIMIVVLMIGISVIVTTLMNFFGISLENLVEMLKDYLIAILGITMIAMYLLSYTISCKIYCKKEI